MVDQILSWTALPAGMYGLDTVRVSVFVSPQLYPAGGVGQLSDFDLGNWPSKIPSLQLFAFANGNFYPAQLQEAWRLRPDVWDALFPGDTLVRSYVQPSYADTAIVSFDQQPLLDYVHSLYASTAGLTVPRVVDGPLAELVERFGDLESHWSPLVQQRKQDLLAGLPQDLPIFEAAPAGLDPTTKQAAAFTRFHDRYQRHTYAPVVMPPQLPLETRYDFHEVVSMLGDQPHILRALGLIFDVSIQLPAGFPATGTIVVASSFPANWSRSHWVLPLTHYELNPNALYFQPAPKDPNEIADGMLRLEGSQFTTHQLDLDGVVGQLEDMAIQLRNAKLHDVAFGAPAADVGGGLVLKTKGADQEPEGLPATRNGGISVGRADRRTTLRNAIEAQNLLPPQPPIADTYTTPDVWAEDVLRGYRVDVLANGNWYSLHRRDGGTTVAGISMPLDPGDEGYVKAASGAERSFGPTKELRVHPSLFGWDGWSLSATRPCKPVLESTVDGSEVPGEKPNVAPPALPFEVATDFHATQGTLPRLRYGHSYQLRARAVDLAGNSLSKQNADAGPLHASAPVTYRRVDPVLPPVLLPRWRYADGESLEHVAIRSDLGMSPAEYSAQLHDGQTYEAKFAYRPQVDRHVAPPKISQQEAETHGVFDAMLQNQGPYAVYLLSLKEQGTFMDQQIYDGTSLQKTVNVSGLDVILPGRVSGGVAALPANRGDGFLEPGSYLINESASIPLPYLPDPFARGMALEMPTGEIVQLAYPQGAEWHDVQPFRLRLKTGSEVTVTGTNPVQVTVPKGEMVELTFSSYFADPSQVERMYMWQHHDPQLMTAALSGRLWQLTPARKLKLVHAVQRPLTVPKVLSIATHDRLDGHTFVHVTSLGLGIHVPSTGTVSLLAEWQEWNDSGGGTPGEAATAPTLVTREGHAFDLPVPYAPGSSFTNANDPAMRFELGDTKRRIVKWRVLGTTRYREYFDRVLWNELTRLGPLKAAATDLLSTAPPPAPRVAYAVPAFSWTEQPNVSIRKGGGLRIWLERPWYVSGHGELCAVIVSDTNDAKADMNRDHVSEWGSDPATNGVRTPANLLEKHVITPGIKKKVVALPDGTMVRALGHEVHFSVEKNQWYCDIDLASGAAYSPFVRLALARLQPGAIEGCHLSKIVKLDFVQVTATRQAQVTWLDPTQAQITVTGPAGATHWGLANELQPIAAASGHRIFARVEQRDSSAVDPVGWQIVAQAQLPAAGIASNQVSWVGTLNVPPPPPGMSRRLVVEEREVHAADAHRGTPSAERLVYAAEIPT